MKTDLLHARIRNEMDVAWVRRRARQICDLLDLDHTGATRFATAVSEISRNAWVHGGGGSVTFSLEDTPVPLVCARIVDEGPGIRDYVPRVGRRGRLQRDEGTVGLYGSGRLVDVFELDTAPGAGTRVRLAMKLDPARGLPSPEALTRLVDGLVRQHSHTLAEELEVQNRELLQTLAELQENRAQLEEHQAQLQEAARRKDEFLAILGHELRNPLSAISNALAVYRMAGEGAAPRVLAIVERQSRQLNRLIDDLLDVVRIAQGKINIQLETVAAGEIVAAVVEMNAGQIQAKQQVLEVDVPETPVWLRADRVRLAQALGNLLNNASKFTPAEGRIRLLVRTIHGRVIFRVEDSGIGLEPAAIPQMFEMFVQGPACRENVKAGLGIGLNVVRSLVALHHGTVEACSDGPGKGATFEIALPLAEGQGTGAADAEGTPAAVSTRQRVIVVDDNRDSADGLAMCLQLWGYEVATASDGEAALALCRADPPQVMVLDINLPGMSGIELARAVRGSVSPPPLMVALSGYSKDHSGLSANDGLFDHHLLKPFSPRALRSLLAQPAAPAGEV